MMKIVAEMMIMANAAVGRRIAAAFPRAALLRRHPPPRREAFGEVGVEEGGVGGCLSAVWLVPPRCVRW